MSADRQENAVRDALIAELRQLVAELSLISHVSGTSYDGKIARDTSESIGGSRPSGSDVEPKPREAEDVAAWWSCYQRRTPDYFARRLARTHSDAALRVLVDEARETLEAWRRTPIPTGQEPAYGSPQWKRWVAESPEDASVLASRFWNPTTGRQVTKRYINKIRKAYRDAA